MWNAAPKKTPPWGPEKHASLIEWSGAVCQPRIHLPKVGGLRSMCSKCFETSASIEKKLQCTFHKNEMVWMKHKSTRLRLLAIKDITISSICFFSSVFSQSFHYWWVGDTPETSPCSWLRGCYCSNPELEIILGKILATPRIPKQPKVRTAFLTAHYQSRGNWWKLHEMNSKLEDTAGWTQRQQVFKVNIKKNLS